MMYERRGKTMTLGNFVFEPHQISCSQSQKRDDHVQNETNTKPKSRSGGAPTGFSVFANKKRTKERNFPFFFVSGHTDNTQMADEVDVDDEQVLEKDPQYPIKVIYCGGMSKKSYFVSETSLSFPSQSFSLLRPCDILIECGLPYDYCKYSPAFAKCKPWLLKNYPALFEKLYSGGAFFLNLTLALRLL
jgi:hypothetical protein